MQYVQIRGGTAESEPKAKAAAVLALIPRGMQMKLG